MCISKTHVNLMTSSYQGNKRLGRASVEISGSAESENRTQSLTSLQMEPTCIANTSMFHDEPASTSAVLFLTLMTSLVRSQERLGDPADYPPDAFDHLRFLYDFIVVGAGSTGCALAADLSEDGEFSVLLIEAGGNPLPDCDVPALYGSLLNTKVDWKYLTEPDPNCCKYLQDQRCALPRGKMLGGTGSMNGNIYTRGHSKDFDEWLAMGNEGWGSKDVKPYFKKQEKLESDRIRAIPGSEDAFGSNGPLSVSDYTSPILAGYTTSDLLLNTSAEAGFRNLGFFTMDDMLGFTQVPGTLHKGERCSSAKAFLTPAINRTNLHVIKNTLVTKVLIDGESKTAQGVAFEKDGKNYSARADKEVILSAGVMNSPQLLMLSGVGPKDHLEEMGIPVIHDNPNVGRNYQDHVGCFGVIATLDVPDQSNAAQEQQETEYRYLADRTGDLAGIGATSIVGMVALDPENDGRPDVRIHDAIIPRGNTASANTFVKQIRVVGEIAQFFVNIITKKCLWAQGMVCLHPKSRGYILLKSSDPHESPRLFNKLLSHPDDLDSLARAAVIATRRIKTPTMQKLNATLMRQPFPECDNMTFPEYEFYRCVMKQMASNFYNPVGSCSMGLVVDARLRVHNITNLRVCDTSIMPSLISGNNNAAAIMVGGRGADLIKQDWKK